jgi:ADP-dependent NAD(P)H-hydrate dehydratase
MTAIELDAAWLAAHPLPQPNARADKNGRGRVLLVGGARLVPGALALTGEAVLRAGAGKLQMATVEAVASALGVLVPEAAMVTLPMRDDGEIAKDAVAALEHLVPRCDLLLVGPGMSATTDTQLLVEGLLGCAPPAVLLDAAALTSVSMQALADAAKRMPIILTPHHGEMARLAKCESRLVDADPVALAVSIAERTGAIVALKGESTWIAGPGEKPLRFMGGCPGLATGGSGDVLAGLIGGFVARGASPQDATAWGVAVHGAAGQRAAQVIGPLGFLARELLPLVPDVLRTL